MEIDQLAEEITSSLREVGRGSRQGHRPSAQDDFGVYTSDLRRVVSAFKKRLTRQSGEFVYQLGLALLDRNNTECRQVAYELIAGHEGAREFLNVGRVEALGLGMDNWCCVDNFCSSVAGVAWREGRISDSAIWRWSKSPDQWWRRAAVVCTVALNTKSRGGKGDVERTLMVCRRVLADDQVLVQKAISWALRELVPWNRAAVEGLLLEERDSISARVRREVERKLTSGRKN